MKDYLREYIFYYEITCNFANDMCTGDCPRVHFSFVVPYSNIMSWGAEGIPRDVEPAVAGEELVGIFTGLEEGDEALELGGILGANVGSLSEKVLGIGDATDKGVDTGVAEA